MLYRAILVLSFIARRLPLRTGQRLGRGLGTVAWHVLRRERRRALVHIAIAFPEWPAEEQRETIRRMFQHLGMSLFEMLWLPNLDAKRFAATTTHEGLEPALAALRAGGVVAFTGHVGTWEWVAHSVARLGMPLTVLQRERREGGLGELITRIRAGVDIVTIDRGSAGGAKEMLQALRRGRALAFLIDQNIRAESVKVPFFGRPALTPIGPAKLAIRAGATIVPIFIHRREDGTHHVRFLEPIATARGDDPVALTARMTKIIEEEIRRAPEQWVWMHERWRERPKWDAGESRLP
jgi:KDO2-lipid IV(A) lauroyltransferase